MMNKMFLGHTITVLVPDDRHIELFEQADKLVLLDEYGMSVTVKETDKGLGVFIISEPSPTIYMNDRQITIEYNNV